MTPAPRRRWFLSIRLWCALVLARALRREWHPEEQGVMPEFEAIRKRKAEVDRKFFGSESKRRWFWQRPTRS